MTIIILIGIVAIIALVWIVSYNSLVKHRNWVEESWAQIDVQLKRRYDLIPNLVETVKGYAKHEQETLTQVIEKRNKIAEPNASRNERIEEDAELNGLLRQLFALSESYPELKANEIFLHLQEELSGTENKIAYARQAYNSMVMRYNTKIESFPQNIIASIHSFTRNDMLDIPDEEKEPVQVRF
ncbi:LemA family protein [Alkalihalobacillus sp. LMS6]|uniref:LemA family protein n=1 Tax=Alkalihalobacillus sp. LMS6 TaxID=2924034 RepID=UPI0020D0652F|nr:LemA family protein [Alkalihalobacillus sp. LMS6]UTR07793.1 LemA family protein [Alkalihalobacillus sp. LMS6]